MEAKAGDKIAPKARVALARAWGNAPVEQMPETVCPKTDGGEGQWFCITCGALPQNNFQAQGHGSEHKTHKLAWRSFVSGKIEEP